MRTNRGSTVFQIHVIEAICKNIYKHFTFENLLRIRPKGVVSKKNIGLLKILCNIVLCSLDEAFKVPTMTQDVAPMINTAWKIPKVP